MVLCLIKHYSVLIRNTCVFTKSHRVLGPFKTLVGRVYALQDARLRLAFYIAKNTPTSVLNITYITLLFIAGPESVKCDWDLGLGFPSRKQ